MALPNYSPSGRILFGSVPWDSSYTNVRLYSNITEQYNDIAQMMDTSAGSNDYAYIGRNRRIKVQIEADRLYHCNYCMYRNDSITDGWIYAFVSDVRYVNDHTSVVSIETDVFQTYLYDVDWSIPACFIERETVPSESDEYLLTNEPDFPLVQVVDGQTDEWFEYPGFVVMTCADVKENQNIAEDILNPTGFYADPAPVCVYKGIPQGCNFYWCPRDTSSGNSETLESYLNRLTKAGSVESVVAIFSVPQIAAQAFEGTGFQDGLPAYPDSPHTVQMTVDAPARGTSVDGYTPRNKKLLYYPYTYVNLTDFNGSTSQLRYELMGSNQFAMKYAISPACQALVFPVDYRGVNDDLDAGIVVACGAQGSWANNTFTTWLAQNSGMIALSIAGIAIGGMMGGATVASATANLNAGRAALAQGARHMSLAGAEAQLASGMRAFAGAGAATGIAYQQLTSASKQPTVTRGQTNYNVLAETGVQGFHLQRIVCKAEIAAQIDEFFDRWGYEVDRVEAVDITSRPSWNYVKTQGASPKSANVAAGTTAPFSRGRGTPAEALDVIRRCFDAGVTFWHTTDNFGNFSLANGVS